MSPDPETPSEIEARLDGSTPRPTDAFRIHMRSLIDVGSTDLVGTRPAALRWKIALAVSVGTLIFAAVIAAVI